MRPVTGWQTDSFCLPDHRRKKACTVFSDKIRMALNRYKIVKKEKDAAEVFQPPPVLYRNSAAAPDGCGIRDRE